MVTTVSSLIHKYLEHLKVSGAAPNTVTNYRICLSKFNELFGSVDPAHLSNRHVEQFQKSLLLKPSSDHRLLILRYLKALRYFVEWCESKSIAIGIKSSEIYRLDKKLQEQTYDWQREYHGAYISRSELHKLQRYWQKDSEVSTLYAIRNRAILAVLGDTGIKVSELMSLNRDDYKPPALIVGDRKLPLEQNTRQILNHYLSIRPDSAAPMFVGYTSIEADKIITQPLGVRGIQRIVTKTAEEVGFNEKVSPRTLRNSRIIQAIAEHELDYHLLTYYFGLSPTNTSYQRFIKIAERLKKTGTI